MNCRCAFNATNTSLLGAAARSDANCDEFELNNSTAKITTHAAAVPIQKRRHGQISSCHTRAKMNETSDVLSVCRFCEGRNAMTCSTTTLSRMASNFGSTELCRSDNNSRGVFMIQSPPSIFSAPCAHNASGISPCPAGVPVMRAISSSEKSSTKCSSNTERCGNAQLVQQFHELLLLLLADEQSCAGVRFVGG